VQTAALERADQREAERAAHVGALSDQVDRAGGQSFGRLDRARRPDQEHGRRRGRVGGERPEERQAVAVLELLRNEREVEPPRVGRPHLRDHADRPDLVAGALERL
jgi:hypothetical protein